MVILEGFGSSPVTLEGSVSLGVVKSNHVLSLRPKGARP
jgi:hypothetical protein